MKTSKHFLLAVAFVLIAASSGVMAQSRKTSAAIPTPPEPILSSTKVNAIEITDGTVGYNSQTKEETTFGYSFLGRTTGAFPGSFTLSMNCTPPPAEGYGSAGTTAIVPPPTVMTGGSWTLPVYTTSMKGSSSYAGSLYGTIAKGEMNYDKRGNATVYFVLNVDGGTQSWDGVRGYATFAGTLLIDEKTQKKTLTGDMVFDIISVFPNP
jgi:hypothetical protein